MATSAPDGAWFNPVAEFLGTAYLRNAFTKGTEQEIDFVVAALGVVVSGIHGVTPGAYRESTPTLDDPELLLVGRRP